MKLISKLSLLIPAPILFLLAGIILTQVDLQAQEPDRVKSELFREVEAAIEQARRGEVPVLAPTLFAKATQFYRQAEAEYHNDVSDNDDVYFKHVVVPSLGELFDY